MASMSGHYYGRSTEHYMAHNEQSTVHKLKETYWTTKQAVIKKLGKKEDAHIVASDSQLDAKLEVFRAIQKSSMDLLRAIEKYQDKLCALSSEENAMGRFLKSHSQQDKTRAGKMMAAVGKSQSFSSQQRLALRVPLVRLYQEVETFRYRAISDTLMTINRMESARTEYRGALLWMKDISEELDPDTYKQLERFRKVQAQVKKTKAKFDKLKLDTMQKIDLLAASRCNMYSHVLASYQTTLLHFWEKTSRTMNAVAESFKGYQYYEFNMLKELAEPSKKLADQTGSSRREEPERDVEEGEEQESDSHEENSSSPADTGQYSSGKTSEDQPPMLKKRLQPQIQEEKPAKVESEEEELLVPRSSQNWTSHQGQYDDDASTLITMHGGDDEEEFSDFTSFVEASPTLPSPIMPLLGEQGNSEEANVTPGELTQGKCSNTANGIENILKTDYHGECLSKGAPENDKFNWSSGYLAKLAAEDSLINWEVPQNHKQDTETDKNSEEDDQIGSAPSGKDALISWGDDEKKPAGQGGDTDSMNNLLEDLDREIGKSSERSKTDDEPFMEFHEDASIEEIKQRQDKEFDLAGKALPSAKKKEQSKKQTGQKDLLSDDLEVEDTEKDDMTILNEILNAPSGGGDDFTKEWQAVFGATPLSANTNYTPVEADQPKNPAEFMPSNLLDMTRQMANINLTGGPPPIGQMGMMAPPPAGAAAMAAGGTAPPAGQGQQQKPKPGKKGGKDMSAWFNLFADLDPLADPDAIGRAPEEMTDA